MPIEIITSVIAVIGGIALAVANYLFNKDKNKAERKKLEADANKTIIETAKISAELAKSLQLNDVNGKGIGNIKDQPIHKVVALHLQLEEWKELHNKLHDLHMSFALCRSNALDQGNKSSNERSPNKTINEVERFSNHWEQCKLVLNSLRTITQDLQYIGYVDDRHKQTNPKKEMKKLDHLQHDLDNAVRDSDINSIADIAGDFSMAVDVYMYKIDKSLRMVVKGMNASS